LTTPQTDIIIQDARTRPSRGYDGIFVAREYPGLENCVARLVSLTSDDWLHIEDLRFVSDRLGTLAPSSNKQTETSSAPTSEEKQERIDADLASCSMAQAQRVAIESALPASNGSNSLAAKALDISRTTLYRKLKQYGGTDNDSTTSRRCV
jgi:DNA-binding NtrC family response regulator